MLNPPLSLLSDDLLVSIVEQLKRLAGPDSNKYLNNLSLADRAFTESCQKYIFRELIIGEWRGIFKDLTKVKKFLEDKPLLAKRVRVVQLGFSLSEESASVFKDPNFTSILQLLAKSLTPPHELNFSGLPPLFIEDPIFVTRQLAESFFSQTLTILRLSKISNVPLPLFLICPKLKEVFLDQVGASTDKSYDNYSDDQCSGRGPPLLEVLEFCNSHTLVEQMIVPPPRFIAPVVLLSNLRVLTLAPHDREGMVYLQPILDAACNSLEELHLSRMNEGKSLILPLAGLVNLSNLPNLQVFSLFTVVNCETIPWNVPPNAPSFGALHDINIILRTIPESNRITNLWFDFLIIGRPPFDKSLKQDWIGMFNEIIRIGGGKPLELEIMLLVTVSSISTGAEEFYMRIMEKAAFLSGCPNICTHWWNPTFWSRGIARFPFGQVRTRCRR